jgi:uncharacterized coiled-coil protein SlyX
MAQLPRVLFSETQDMVKASSTPRVVETTRAGAIRYQLEHVRCGKAACRSCAAGRAHGPYWYAYGRKGGRTVRRYCGRELPKEVAAARRTAHREALQRRALNHEYLFDTMTALETIGEVLCRTDEHCRYREPEDLERADLAELEPLSSEIEDCVDELNDAVSKLRRRVRGASKRVLQLVDEAQELLEEAEYDSAAEEATLYGGA